MERKDNPMEHDQSGKRDETLVLGLFRGYIGLAFLVILIIFAIWFIATRF
jgi:hypothetical protein